MKNKPHSQSIEGDRLTRYLEMLEERLAGSVPEDARRDFVAETGFWIEKSARDGALLGASYDEALQAAIRKHGEVSKVADAYALEYYEDEINSPVYKSLGRANTTVVAVLGLAIVLYMVFLQLLVFLPDGAALQISLTPAELRERFPEPLPLPDFSWRFFMTVGYPIVAPFIAGWLCGRLIPVRAAAAVGRVLVVMNIGAFLLGATLLPQLNGLLYALFLTLFWLPVGCLTAHFSSSLLRWQHRRSWKESGAYPPSSINSQEAGSL